MAEARARRANGTAASVRALGMAPAADGGQTGGLLHAALARFEAGRLEEAEALLGRVLEREPANADGLNMQGVIDYKLGRLEAAARRLKKALRADPQKTESYLNAASVARARGRPAEAKRLLERALRVAPDSAAAHANLANVLADMGRHREAEAALRRAAELEPEAALFRHNLAYGLAAEGRLAEAFEVIQAAEAEGLDCREAYLRIGEERLNAGAYAEAVMVFAEALQTHADDAGALAGMAYALIAEERYADAMTFADHGLELHPDHAMLHGARGHILAEANRLAEALPHFERRAELQPNNAPARANLAVLLRWLDRPAEARAAVDEALALDPEDSTANALLAAFLREEGRFAEAVERFERALARTPDSGSVLYSLYGIKKDVTEADDAAAILAALERKDSVTLKELIEYNFTLGDVFDRLRSPERAIFYYRAANDLKRSQLAQQGTRYVRGAHEAFVAGCERLFTPAAFARLRPYGHRSERPIFIIGMPRSGTTLIEQILSAHPQVHGAGELTAMKDITRARDAAAAAAGGEGFPAWAADLDGAAIAEMAERYLARLAELAGEAAERVTDKMPHNFQLAGLIAVLFPAARIVHCRRDPVDTCLSCYRQNFSSPHPYSNDMADLGHHYRLYERLMAHWRAVLPAPMYEVRYEELVAEPERISRELVAFCGLQWDAACLRFHEAERSVRTASLWQVRQPIYRRAVRRWKPYEPYIGPLLEALGDSAAAAAE